MKPNESAFPLTRLSPMQAGLSAVNQPSAKGLTKREYIAIAAMQGLIASMANPGCASLPTAQSDFDQVSKAAYGYADAMIKAGSE